MKCSICVSNSQAMRVMGEGEIVMDTIALNLSFQLFTKLSVRSMLAISMTCKHLKTCFNEYKKQYLTIKAGESTLYLYQIEMFTWIRDMWSNNSGTRILKLQASMSSGKTLVALHSVFNLLGRLGKKASHGIIFCPGATIRAWIDEANTHYKVGANKNIESRKVLFHSSTRKADTLFIESCVSENCMSKLRGKIIVTTPLTNLVNTEMYVQYFIANASCIVFDEGHRNTKAYQNIIDHTEQDATNRILIMSASTIAVGDKHRDRPIKSEYMKINLMPSTLPDLDKTSSVLLPKNGESLSDLLNKVISRSTASHIIVVQPNPEEEVKFTTTHKEYDFYNRQVTSLNKFEKIGGVLKTYIKRVNAGLNLNYGNHLIIVNPINCSLATIQQMIGRVYRQSNVHKSIKVNILVPQYNSVWVVSRLAMIIPKPDFLQSKTSVTRIESIIDTLRKFNVNLDSLTSQEITLLFGSVDSLYKDEAYLHPYYSSFPSHIPIPCLLVCMGIE